MKKKHKAEPKGRMGRRRFLPTVFCLLISLSLLPACYEPQSGCLDNEALNYDLDADNPCSDCCEYPSLVLDVQHRFITDSTTAGIIPGISVHLDDFGNPFRIKQFRCFISNIHLQDAAAQPLEVEEKLGLVVIEGPRIRLDTVEDNFALVDAAQLNDYTIGTIRGGGLFQRVSFDLGLVEPASKADVNEIPVDHPLDAPDMYLSDSLGYVFLDLALYRDTAQATLDSVSMQLDKTTPIPPFGFTVDDFDLNPGFNAEVVLRIDYGALLSGVNVKTDAMEQIRQKIVNNLANAFKVIEVTANNR